MCHNGLEDEQLAESGGVGLARHRVFGGKEDVYADGAFGSITVVFELECVVVLGVCVFSIFASIVFEWRQA